MTDYKVHQRPDGSLVDNFSYMGQWHYQLIKHVHSGELVYSMHEYYPATEKMKEGWTLNPITVSGDSRAEVRWMLEQMLIDLDVHGTKEVKHEP